IPPPAESTTAAPSGTTYSIALVASTVSSLPKCTSTLSGTTAYVQSPVSLYSCQAPVWLPIPCTSLLAGAVAYASSTQTLLACASGSWTVVPLPPGPQGPVGATGPQGPQGDAGAVSLVVQVPVAAGTPCAFGGTAVESGVDTNGDGQLEGGAAG